MDIPAGVDLCFSNQNFKVLLFLEADHKLILGDGPPLSMRSGDLLIQPFAINQSYRATRRNAASRIHVMRFLLDLPLIEQGKVRRSKAASFKSETMRVFLKTHISGIVHLPQFITLPIQKQIERIRAEIEACRAGYRLEVSHLVFSVLIEIVRRMSPTGLTGPSPALKKSEEIVTRAKQYIIENMASPLTLDQIAWHVRLSREHLGRLFRAVSGQTVFEFLADQRLEVAKTHLCNPNLSVVEVARRCGFSSSSLFCRTFKNATKITPSQYRLQRMSEVRFSPSEYADPELRRSTIRAEFF